MVQVELDDFGGVPTSIRGHAFHYFPEGRQVPPEVTEHVFRYSFRHDSLTMHHPRVRQVVWRTALGGVWLSLLHWDDGTDLELLDHLAISGADISSALDRALLCDVNEPMCRNCDNRSVVLVASDAPPATAGQRYEHAMTTVCPNCGDPNYVRHAEVLA